MLLKTTPTPQSVEASTQNSTGDTRGGREIEEPQNDNESCSRHQAISERTLWFGIFLTKGDDALVKEAANRYKDGR